MWSERLKETDKNANQAEPPKEKLYSIYYIKIFDMSNFMSRRRLYFVVEPQELCKTRAAKGRRT